MNEAEYEPVVELIENHGFTLINFANDPKYLGNKDYFKDGSHLNDRGADEFTRDLTSRLMEL